MDSIEQKIANKTVTVDDFNQLIAEALGSSAVDRVRRRVRRTPTDNHIDAKGHQHLGLPKFQARVVPKRKRDNSRTQMRHRGRSAHQRSAKSQAYSEALEILLALYGKPVTEDTIRVIKDKAPLQRLVAALLVRGDLDQGWLARLNEVLHGR